MRPLLWHIRVGVDAVGWRGVSGIVLLVLAALLAATAIPARWSDLALSSQEAEALQSRYLMSGPEANRNGFSAAEQLSNFYAFFPPLSTLPEWLERIYAAADRGGVRIDAGEYRLLPDRGARLSRYQITLPVRGSYTQVRMFVAELLAEVPAAAVEEIAFRRESIGSAALDVRLRLTLHMRSG